MIPFYFIALNGCEQSLLCLINFITVFHCLHLWSAYVIGIHYKTSMEELRSIVCCIKLHSWLGRSYRIAQKFDSESITKFCSKMYQ